MPSNATSADDIAVAVKKAMRKSFVLGFVLGTCGGMLTTIVVVISFTVSQERRSPLARWEKPLQRLVEEFAEFEQRSGRNPV